MIIVQKRYTREDIKNNPWLTYVYGDNDTRSGNAGQALACRGFPNTIGIRTKKKPSVGPDAYYSDTEYVDNVAKIKEDLDGIERLLKKHHIVVFPLDGIGTGLAELRLRAPETHIYLNNRLVSILEKYRVPEDDLDTAVIALNPKAFTIVANRIGVNEIERMKFMAVSHLRGYNVVVDPEILHHLVRKIAKRVLERNPFNIEDPLGKDADFDC